MIGSIERLRQRVNVRAFAPALLLVVGVPTHPDPVGKRATGYAGVLPVPATAATSQTSAARLDPLLDGRRDTRAERGRVLYATGHASHDTTVAHPRHHPCPDRRIGQTNPHATSPNS